MAREISLNSSEWCNIIFEGKNQAYGAYALRQESSKRHYTAFVIVTFFACLIFFALVFTKRLGVNKDIDKVTDGVFITVLTSPEKEKVPIRLEPEEAARPKVAPAIKFLVPIIKPDEQVKPEDEIPPMNVITEFHGVISSVNNDGEDINGVDPAIVNLNHQIGGGENVEVNTIVDVPEVQPCFPGGESELIQYLNKAIRYPIIAQENNIQGKVTVQFVVGRDGTIEDVLIARGVDISLDNEALRVIRNMPKWIPGKQGGRAVKVRFYLPVVFRLQ
ncbi:MAG: energy transducer TonB [Paludibacteraceae bacterium]